ncbi:valine--tRNA ligase [Candidatus Uhrbacteria bacterium]|nr:valine--tRNA ligase [Candidatus Uhrbacteria bacterium]
MPELAKAYEANQYEDDIYAAWEASGYFSPDNLPVTSRNSQLAARSKKQEAFTIVIPPPNVTGQLHMGHAAMLAIEDLMIRYHRMKGDRTLWVPGLDHATIATQNVVEKKIWKEEKKTRHDLGREEFLKRVDTFVQASKVVIRTQIKKMGASCDWSRERYTLDQGLSLAVRTMFTKMYEDGLIYRGNRIVNWCTRCASTLADDEVNYREEKSKFYYLKYGPVIIGTARPETKFLDKIIIVHPDDARYTHLHGKEFDVPWIDGTVKAKVIADVAGDPEIGTGAMTITPAHSFEDFALAQKYGIEIHQIIGQDGKMTEAAGGMAGMPVEQCREQVVARLQEKGLVERIDENYVHNLSVCYRCDTPIQPLVSKQWFVAVDKKVNSRERVSGLQRPVLRSLKERAIDAVKSSDITIIPDRFNKTYFQWMDNLHDWCISRQLWFGHRIPVWYKRDPNLRMHPNDPNQDEAAIYVGIEPPGGEGWTQDPDTLDTWFSAGLWTFSTLGWPDAQKTSPQPSPKGRGRKSPLLIGEGEGEVPMNDLQLFHPTSVMETGYDILFLWVARMIMMTTYALDEVPFKHVYLHGLVRDKLGRKMSKSLGNGIDPLDVIAKYGADPVRLSLIIGSTPGNDVRLYDEKIAGFRNFVNKLWNIGRFILSNKANSQFPIPNSQPQTLADRWMLSRLHRVIQDVTNDIEAFRFSQAGERLRDFTWGDFADWYVEIAKQQLAASSLQQSTLGILHSTFCILLKLWHPFTPYVTEVLWKHLHRITESQNHRINLLMVAEWPKADKKLIDEKSEKEFALIQDVITAIRGMRSEYQLAASVPLTAYIITESQNHRITLQENSSLIKKLARVEELTIKKSGGAGSGFAGKADRPKESIALAVGTLEIFIPIGGILDKEKEIARIEREIEKLGNYRKQLEGKLENREYVDKAPANIVDGERAKMEETKLRIKTLETQLESLQT